MYIGKDRETGNYYKNNFLLRYLIEALESVMCDVIKIRLKGRIATRSQENKSST